MNIIPVKYVYTSTRSGEPVIKTALINLDRVSYIIPKDDPGMCQVRFSNGTLMTVQASIEDIEAELVNPAWRTTTKPGVVTVPKRHPDALGECMECGCPADGVTVAAMCCLGCHSDQIRIYSEEA